MDGLEEVDATISEGDESLSIFLYHGVGVGVVLSDLDVAHGEVAEGPDVGGTAHQFFVEGDAGDVGGAQHSAGRARGRVDQLVGVAAVGFVPDPDVH